MRRFLAKEHETVVLSEAELAANEAKTNIIFNEVEELSHEIDRASDIAEALENMQVIMSGSEEPTARELALINVANQMAMAGDENKVALVPAEESYYRRHTALEGIGEAIANVWKAIWSMISRLFNAIFSLFGGGSNGGVGGGAALERARARTDELKKKVEQFVKEQRQAREREVTVTGSDVLFTLNSKEEGATVVALAETFGNDGFIDGLVKTGASVYEIAKIDKLEDRLFKMSEVITFIGAIREHVAAGAEHVAKSSNSRVIKQEDKLSVGLPYNKRFVATLMKEGVAMESFALESDEEIDAEPVNSAMADALAKAFDKMADAAGKQSRVSKKAANMHAKAEEMKAEANAEQPNAKKVYQLTTEVLHIFSDVTTGIRLKIEDNTDKLPESGKMRVLPLETILDNLTEGVTYLDSVTKSFNSGKAKMEQFKKEMEAISDAMLKKSSEHTATRQEAYFSRVLGNQVKMLAGLLGFAYFDMYKFILYSIDTKIKSFNFMLNAYTKPE